MLTDYIDPLERAVACPNQDVVYGLGLLALEQSPVVVQVPDFGDRFWVYQIVDLRTDSFVQLGKMYGSKPGFYLLVGPAWSGEVPKGITKVFRCSSNTGLVAPRIFQDDTPEDKRAVQAPRDGVMMYPLEEYDGKMKTTNWTKFPICGPRRTVTRRRVGRSPTSSPTNCRSCSPTHRRCPARRHATRKCWLCSRRSSPTRSSRPPSPRGRKNRTSF